jgi:hypothetical protein
LSFAARCGVESATAPLSRGESKKSGALRTLDAIHLASAELFMDRLPTSRLTFVTADRRQTAVAAIVGMAPLPV